MSKRNDYLRGIGINLYRNQWVLTSSEQVLGGQTVDAPPVRLVEFSDRQKLMRIISELLTENIPVVSQPDWDHPQMAVSIRAQALGLKSWPAFVKHARCFNLELHKGKLVLEEWPKEGSSFTADALWRKEFPRGGVKRAVEFLLRKTSGNRRGDTG